MVKLPLGQRICCSKLLALGVLALLSAGASVAAADGRLYDPMRPQVGTATVAQQLPAEQELSLEVIVFADDRCSAVINGQNVVEGDQFKGYRVETISADAVLLSKASSTKRLTMHAGGKGKMHVTPVATKQ